MKIEFLVVSALVGLIVGFILGRIRPKNMDIYQFLRKIYINLDNFILILSFLIVCSSIYFSTINKLEKFASVAINIFASVIFSWLLTKKSSKEEFREQEQELALRSFRHINYIESAANTAYKKIENYLSEDVELDEKAKLMLSSAMDQIKYIQGGINTCKMDWHDMLSDEEKKHYKNDDASENVMDEDYGTVDVVVPIVGYNQ
ncbi:MAG: hypothetical protein Q4D32_06245, partial [Eubacteriales bacterium]|nr:hypothetical protein [Eubacteriales bacterium]